MSVLGYFDLSRSGGPRNAPAGAIPVVPQYIALASGIVVEPFVHKYMETHGFDVTLSRVALQVVFGLIMGLIIFPGVYRNAFDPTRPLFVQLCAIFASGIGWQSLFQAATSSTQ